MCECQVDHDTKVLIVMYQTILRSLLVSWDMLKDVLGFIFFFLVLFALIGLITFKGVFSRRCYAMQPDGQCKCHIAFTVCILSYIVDIRCSCTTTITLLWLLFRDDSHGGL